MRTFAYSVLVLSGLLTNVSAAADPVKVPSDASLKKLAADTVAKAKKKELADGKGQHGPGGPGQPGKDPGAKLGGSNKPKLERAAPARAGNGAVRNLNQSAQRMQQNPMDAVARQNYQNAALRAATASYLIDKEAASGKYDASNYSKIKSSLGASVQQPVVAAPTVTDVPSSALARSVASAPATPASDALKAASSSISSDTLSPRNASGPSAEELAGRSPAAAALAQGSPSVSPAFDAANRLVDQVAADLSGAQLASIGVSPDVANASPTLLTRALLTAAVGEPEAERAMSPPTDEERHERGEDGSLAFVSTPDPSKLEALQQLSSDEREVLSALVKKAVDDTAEVAAEESAKAAKDGVPLEAPALTDLREAKKSAPAYDSLLHRLNNVVESALLGDPKLRAAFSRRSSAVLASLGVAPVAASLGLPAALETTDPAARQRGLLALLVVALGGLIVTAGLRRRRQQPPV